MKKFIGALVAFGAVMAMAVGAQAATYSAGTAAAGDDNVVIPVIVTPDEGEEANVNGYVITLTYDGTKISPVSSLTPDKTNADCYATVDEAFSSGILVSDVVSGQGTSEETLAVAWAAADYVTVDAEAVMATVEFEFVGTVTEDIPVTVAVASVTSNGSSIDDESTYTVSNGEVTVGSSLIYGDINNDTAVDSYDASVALQYYSDPVTNALTSEQFKVADVNNDSVVDSFDASLILQYYGGSITVFPVEE